MKFDIGDRVRVTEKRYDAPGFRQSGGTGIIIDRIGGDDSIWVKVKLDKKLPDLGHTYGYDGNCMGYRWDDIELVEKGPGSWMADNREYYNLVSGTGAEI